MPFHELAELKRQRSGYHSDVPFVTETLDQVCVDSVHPSTAVEILGYKDESARR
jgi:hypothetical protein